MKLSNKFKFVAFITVLFMAVSCVYSSDNAADLYRKAATLYKADKNIEGMLINVINGKIEPNDAIKEFIKTNRPAIDTVIQASEIKDCSWELDTSDGMGMILPQNKCRIRALANLVLADAKILAKNSDYRNAISHCISVYKMALRGNDYLDLTYLLGTIISGLTNDCIMQIISDMPPNLEILNELKQQLEAVDKIPFSLKSAVLGGREMILREILIISMKPERVKDYKSFIDENKPDKAANLDEAEIGRNRIYCENYFASIIDATDKPYLEGHKALEDLDKKLDIEDANNMSCPDIS